MDAIALFDPIGTGKKLKTAAHDLGYKVVGVFIQPKKTLEEIYHIQSEEELFRDCDHVITATTRDAILKELKDSPFSIKAVIAATEGAVELADQVAEDLQLFRNPLDLSKARRDKGEMRKILKENHFSCPDFEKCQSETKVSHFAKNHFFPLVIKTPKGGLTDKVFVCENLKELMNSYHQIETEPDLWGQRAEYALIEEFILGKEYIVDTFSDGKRVHVTDIWLYDKIDTETYKNVYYNVFSIPLTEPSVQHLIDHAIRITSAFHIIRGPSHLEFKDDPLRGPTLIEIGARLVGASLPDFIQKYSNFDPYKATIEVFAKGKLTLPDPIVFQKHFGVAFCPVLTGGTVQKISGIDQIQKLPSYEVHYLRVKKGQRISPSTIASTSPLTVYLAHADWSQVQKDLAATHELFQLELTSE